MDAVRDAVGDAVDEAKTALPDAEEAKDAVVGALADVKDVVAEALAPQADGTEDGGATTSSGLKTPQRECCCERLPLLALAHVSAAALPVSLLCSIPATTAALDAASRPPSVGFLHVPAGLLTVTPTLTRALTTREAKAALEAQAQAAAAKSIQASTIFKALFA